MDAADVTYMYIKKVKIKMDLFFTHALMTFGDSGRITHYEKGIFSGKKQSKSNTRTRMLRGSPSI